MKALEIKLVFEYQENFSFDRKMLFDLKELFKDIDFDVPVKGISPNRNEMVFTFGSKAKTRE